MRRKEGFGIETEEVRLERGVVLVRANRWRGLKNGVSTREVPLFPELEFILRGYLEGPRAPTGRLLFPSPFASGERPLMHMRRTLERFPKPDRLRGRGGRDADPDALPPLRTGILRHSYCATRLQTLDWGRPLALYTVPARWATRTRGWCSGSTDTSAGSGPRRLYAA